MPCPDPDLESVQATARAPSRAPPVVDAVSAQAGLSPARQNAHGQDTATETLQKGATEPGSKVAVCTRCRSPRWAAQLAAQRDGGVSDHAAAVGDAEDDEEDDRPVLKVREERYCTLCAVRLIRYRASRGAGGYALARRACNMRRHFATQQQRQHSQQSSGSASESLKSAQSQHEEGRVVLALSGGPNSRALLHLTADLFGAEMSISAKQRRRQATIAQQDAATSAGSIVHVGKNGASSGPSQDDPQLASNGPHAAAEDDDALSVQSDLTSMAASDFGAGKATGKGKSKATRRGGTQRPEDISAIDVLHVDDSALFCAQDGTDAIVGTLERTRRERQEKLQHMIDAQNALVEEARQEGADRRQRYRLVLINLEDVFCSDEQLASRLLSGRPAEAHDDGGHGASWMCTVRHDPNTSLYGAHAPSATSKTNREMLLELFERVTATPASASSAGSVRSAITRAEDLHRVLMDTLIRRVALLPDATGRQAYQSLLLGTSATRSAIRLMDALSKGEGAKLAVMHAAAQWYGLPSSDAAESAAQSDAQRVLVLRPFSECTAKEITWLVRDQELDFLQPRDLATSPLLVGGNPAKREHLQPGGKASLERLTEEFVLSLDASVSSTVSTIGRTGSKLVLSSSAGSLDGNQTAVQVIGPSVKLRSKLAAAPLASAERITAESFLDPTFYARTMPPAHAKAVQELCDIPCFPPLRSFSRTTAPPICPLCCMPAQADDARAWRSKISIRSLQGRDSADHASTGSFGDLIDLSAVLCYACTLVLDLSPTANEQAVAELPLPPYVHSVCSSLRSSAAESRAHLGEDGPHAESAESGPGTPQANGTTRLISKKVERSDMREQLDAFLLEDAE